MNRRSATSERGPAGGRAALAPRPPARGPGRAPRRRRSRIAWLLFAVLAVTAFGGAWYQIHRTMPAWYARLWYPLEYQEPIRTEAARYDLDPALVAAVINTESGFAPDSRSAAGAVGLMQVVPDTARFMAKQADRPSPSPERIAEPAVNIAYGSRYLRYLIDRYGTVELALAAYNGGPSNVSGWLEDARAKGNTLRIPEDIPFPETRGFVSRVLRAVRSTTGPTAIACSSARARVPAQNP